MATKFTSWSKIKKGQKFKVLKNQTNGGQTSSSIVLNKTYVTRKDGSGYSNYVYDIVQGNGSVIYAKDCVLIEETVDEMKKDLLELEKQCESEISKIINKYKSLKEELKLKINFCEESKLEIYDEDVHKVYKALSTLKENSTDGEKAKVIAELIKK